MPVELPFTVENWPRWRCHNLWRDYVYGTRGFCLFSFWWSHQFVGVTLLNFAVEFNRKA